MSSRVCATICMHSVPLIEKVGHCVPVQGRIPRIFGGGGGGCREEGGGGGVGVPRSAKEAN